MVSGDEEEEEGKEEQVERAGGMASLMLADGMGGAWAGRMRWHSPLGRASMPRAASGKSPVEPCRALDDLPQRGWWLERDGSTEEAFLVLMQQQSRITAALAR